jgi:hypothetical protein
MKTDDLISALAADTRPPPRVAGLLLPGLALAFAAALWLVWLTLGFRADLAAALANPVSAMRFVLTGALALAGAQLALVLSRPEGRDLARFWPLVAVAAVALALWAWTFAAVPPGGRQMALVGKTMATCLVAIPLLSILPVAVLMLALRRGATTAPALSGFAAGLGGGGLAAMAYAAHCTEDSPLFYVTWYGAAIGLVTLAATLAGARLLRW